MSLDDLPPRTQQRPARDPDGPRADRAPPAVAKITRAEELRLQLADDIVRGALAPGAPLDETEIAKRFNVSRTPVRMALVRLEEEGLLEAIPSGGFMVKSFS